MWAVTTLRAYGGVDGDERRADRRRRLLEAAVDLMAEGGPATVTVTGTCKRAGLTARYFYEHFPNRDALVAAIVDAESEAIITVALAAVAAAGGGPQDRGEVAIGALLDAFTADPRAARITRERGNDEVVLRMRAAVTARLTAAFADNADLMWPGIHADRQRILLASSLTIGGVLQLIVTWLEGQTDLTREDVARIGAQFTIATGRTVLSG